ncbi:MAG: peptidoglycan-binding protein [Treponema sp.]|nr:peptidoglycan-binding protein [Treponema sp.]
MKKRTFVVVLFLLVNGLFAQGQNFSRVIEIKKNRMHGADVTSLQNRLLSLGFKQVGQVDGWYGPLTEGAVRTAQYFLGFPRNGKVTKAFWTVVFDTRQDALLKSIGAISGYNQNNFTIASNRIGTNGDFDDIVVSSLKGETKMVLFQHVNEGLIIFRFKVYYLPERTFIVQDVYYGDYRIRIYLKNAQGFFELKNGTPVQADPALEGILNRLAEYAAPPAVPAPAAPVQAPPAPAAPAPAAVLPAPAVPAASAPASPASGALEPAAVPSAP